MEARGICRRFAGVVALDSVDLAVPAGQVTAVVGENGAGKSTLMRILAGVDRPDTGELFVDGAAVRLRSVRDGEALGIALIHQELNLCDNLSAGANVLLGREPRGRLGWMSPRAIDARAQPFLRRVGFELPPRTPLRQLSIGQRQLVEIAKALSQEVNSDGGGRVLIMDEPTSSLTAEESARLFAVIRDLKASGVAVLYISHRLGEVEALADRVVGLRDGHNSGELSADAIGHRAMVRLMVGRDLEVEPRTSVVAARGSPRLAVQGLATAAFPGQAVGFRVERGEIVGLAGLVGSGRSELLETLFGARAPAAPGRVEVDGTAVPPGSVRAAMAAGLALVPEDRKTQGLLLDQTVGDNLSLARLSVDSAGGAARSGPKGLGWVDRRAVRAGVASTMASFSVKAPTPEVPVRTLSGGNQQKVALGKWLVRQPAVLLLDEPTRGVDVGAKDEIYRHLDRLARSGMAILFASSELAEVLALADRILVLHDGRLVGELPRHDATEERIMRLATAAHASAEGLPQ